MKKVTKIILLLLCAVCAFGLFACNGGGGDSEKEGLSYYRVAKDGEDPYYVIDGYVDDGETTVLTIPSVLGDKNEPVKRIKAGAFSDNGTLTEIVVPSSVTEIDAGAFSGMTKLTKITLPFIGGKLNADGYIHETKTDVNKAVDSERLFGYIFGTESYNFGTALNQRYASTAADDSDNKYAVTYYIPVTLKEVVITANDYTLPMYAFYGNNSVNKISFTGTVKGIGDYAFYGNTFIAAMSLPASVERIGDHAFDGCTSLSTLNVASDTVKIGEYAFKGIADEDFTVKAGYSLGAYAFTASAVKTVTLDIAEVPYYAFYNCLNLETVNVTANVKKIGGYAFAGCTALNKFGTSEANAVAANGTINLAGITAVYGMAFSNLNASVTYTVTNAPAGTDLSSVFYNTKTLA